MASIPLPALHVQAPDQNSGLNNIAQLYQIMREKALLPGQVQAQQQNLASGAADVQLKQQQVANQQAGLKAMQEWDGKDPNDLVGLYAKHGADANTVINLKNNIIKQKQDLANLDKDTLANEATRNDQLLGHIDAIRGITDPEQRATTAKTQAQQILSAGLVKDPQTAQMVQAIAAGQMVPDDGQLDLFEKGLRSHSKLLEDAKNEAQAKEATARAGEAGAQQKKIETEINQANPADQNIARQKYQGILQTIQTKGIGAVPPEDLTWARAHEAAETKRTTQSDTLGVTSNNVSGPAGLSVVGAGRGRPPAVVPPANTLIPPSGGGAAAGGGPAVPPANTPVPANPSPANLKESIVDQIGQYKLNPQMLSRMAVKHPDIIAQVSSQYPDWNQPQYNAINHMITSFTSGKESQSINAINTAMGHVKELDDAVDALNNGKVTILNNIANKLGAGVGQDPQTTFRLIVHRVGPEISSAYIPGGGGEMERFANAADFSENLAPNQLHANAAETVKLLRSKVGALENQWKNNVPASMGEFQKRFISPAAQEAFDKFAGKSGAGGGANLIYARDPQGKLHSAPAGTALPAGWTQEKQ